MEQPSPSPTAQPSPSPLPAAAVSTPAEVTPAASPTEPPAQPTVAALAQPTVVDFSSELPDLSNSEASVTIDVAAGAPEAGADGSEAHPFPKISAARAAVVGSLASGTATRVRIAAGVYREDLRSFLNFQKEGAAARNTLLIVEGDPSGGTVLSGSVESQGKTDFQPAAWLPVPGQPGLYMNEWPFDAPPDAGPWIQSYGFAMLPGLMQRSEMIWVDDAPMRQVLAERYKWEDPDGPRGYKDRGTGQGGDASNKPGQLVFDGLELKSPDDLREPGTFAVYNAPQAPANLKGKIFLRLPAGILMDGVKKIEAGQWKGTAWSPMLVVRAKNSIVLRNLTIRHVTTGPMGTALVVNECDGFLLENLNVSDNVASGLSLGSSHNGTLRHVKANNNGSNGIGAGEGSSRILIEDCETSFNNYRGGWAAWTAWHASGSKSGGVQKIHFRRHASVGNYANGLWFDVYCRDILVEDSFFLGNKRMGVMFELTKPRGGPQILRNSVCAFNDNTGIFLSMASNSSVVGCLLVGNGGGGFVEDEAKNTQILYKFAPHPQGPKSAADWQSVVIQNNVMASASARISDFISRKSTPAEQFPYVLGVLDSNHNTYWSSEAAGFRLPDESWGDLAQWRGILEASGAPGGRDADSRWEDPGLAPDPKTEFLPGTDSGISRRARGMGVVLPEASIAEYWRRMDSGGYSSPALEYRRQQD